MSYKLKASEKFLVPLMITGLIFVGRFSMDGCLPSLPAIAQFFDVSHSQAQYIFTAFVFGFGVSQLLYGPLSDRYGRKKILLLGYGIFLLGSGLCVFAGSLEILVGARLLAGLGAGAGAAMRLAIISDCYEGADLARVWNYTTSAIVLGMMAGPLVGSFIQTYFGWRYNFLLLSAYIITLNIMLFSFFPETHLNNLKSSTFGEVCKNYFTLISNKSFLFYSISSALSVSGLLVYFQYSPFILIKGMGYSVAHYGIINMSMGLVFICGGQLFSVFKNRMSDNNIISMGFMLYFVSGILLLFFTLFDFFNIFTLMIPAYFYVIGMRLVMPNTMSEALRLGKGISGVASALIGVIVTGGASLVSYFAAQFSLGNFAPLGALFLCIGLITLALVFVNKKQEILC